MANKIQLRRDISTNWTNTNPILSQGEQGIETDTNKIKFGDGVTAWNSLDYAYYTKDESVALAKGFKNLIINGNEKINSRNFNGDWSSIAIGAYGYDRMKKASTTEKSQTIEDGYYIPNTTYTLSGTNITTQQLTSPSSGNWVLTFPQNAINIQLEEGDVATPFERTDPAIELLRCQRYLPYRSKVGVPYSTVMGGIAINTTTVRCYIYANARIIPTTLTYQGNFVIFGNTTQNVTNIVMSTTSTLRVLIVDVICASGLTVGNYYIVRNNNDATAYIEIPAEL